MNVETETREDVLVVRYSGLHACRPEDHAKEKETRLFFCDAVARGDLLFLIDLRGLEVRFPSGLSDLSAAWFRALLHPEQISRGVRTAFIWSSKDKSSRWNLVGFGQAVDAFSEVSEALDFLKSDRPVRLQTMHGEEQ